MPAVSPDLNDRERACVEQALHTARIAFVAMIDSKRREDIPNPYVVPMNFAYEPPSPCAPESEGRLLLHTGPGRKADALDHDPRVCVSVISQEELRLGPTPCEDGYLYQSVVLEGRALLLTDDVKRERALRAIVAKYDPDAIAKPFDARIFAQTLLYAVDIEAIGFKERSRHS